MYRLLVLCCVLSLAAGCCSGPCLPCSDESSSEVKNGSNFQFDKSDIPDKLSGELSIIYGEQGAKTQESRVQTYTVAKGDTISEIARRFDVQSADIIKANNITNPSKIAPGLKLTIPVKNGWQYYSASSTQEAPLPSFSDKPPDTKVSKSGFLWPVDGGKVAFNKGCDGMYIKSSPNACVRAANSGTIKFASEGMQGYGKVVIIEHSNNLLSLYAFNSRILVKSGDKVERGKPIAVSGGYSRSSSNQVLFMMFKSSYTVDPDDYLP